MNTLISDDPHPAITCRWLELDDDVPKELLPAAEELIERLSGDYRRLHSEEQCFIAHPKDYPSRLGVLVEFEFYDGYIPGAEQTAHLTEKAREKFPGVDMYLVPVGTEFVFHERAAARGFIPGPLVTAELVEAVATYISESLYP